MKKGIEIGRKPRKDDLVLKADDMSDNQDNYECKVKNSMGEAARKVFAGSEPSSDRRFRTRKLCGGRGRKSSSRV
jgi:hypothetical protein